ncbi:MAG TPA: TadE/TadG family type IV pilus assembly protein [Candidatus Eisenbacteria bacterium]|nr:TadE/TadG family type IV pilus assembly protein [Candidatus Eisenbacteria bacterium]
MSRSAVSSDKGQTLVELTLILPLMLLLVYGVVEVGSAISTYLTLTHTVREGANLASRGTDPDDALDAIIAAADPTMGAGNPGQWRIIYSRIVQEPGTPCTPECTYIIDNIEPNGQIVRGALAQSSKLGTEGSVVNAAVGGFNNVAPGQTFHAIEVFYDYGPDVITFVGSGFDKIFYERAIFTDVSGTAN